jgi:hypothetical protein
MKISQLLESALDKSNFQTLNGYIEFCLKFLDYKEQVFKQ